MYCIIFPMFFLVDLIINFYFVTQNISNTVFLWQSEQCGFFKWCDEIASGQFPKFKSPIKAYQQQHNDIIDLVNHGLKSPMNHGKQHSGTDHLYPICSCGAKRCILMTVHDGENAGRKYFACPIKKVN